MQKSELKIFVVKIVRTRSAAQRCPPLHSVHNNQPQFVAVIWKMIPPLALNCEQSGSPRLRIKTKPKLFFPNEFFVRSRVARWHVIKPKKTSLGKFWRDLQWKMLV
jgi:hypothetical protein